jgi:hypothetical protein
VRKSECRISTRVPTPAKAYQADPVDHGPPRAAECPVDFSLTSRSWNVRLTAGAERHARDEKLSRHLAACSWRAGMTPDVPRAPLLVLLPRQRFFSGQECTKRPRRQPNPQLRRLLATAGQWRHHTADIAGLRSRTRKMGAPRLNCIGSAWCWRPPIAITPHPSPVDIPADIPRRQRFLPFVSRPQQP